MIVALDGVNPAWGWIAPRSCTAAHWLPAQPWPDGSPLNELHHMCAAGAERELHLEFEATKGQSPVINRQGITVGRAPGCDLRLDARSASDRHARLHQCGEWRWGGYLALACHVGAGEACWCSGKAFFTQCLGHQHAGTPANPGPAPNTICGQGHLSHARPGTLRNFASEPRAAALSASIPCCCRQG